MIFRQVLRLVLLISRGSIPMVITGYFLSRVMGSPALGNLT